MAKKMYELLAGTHTGKGNPAPRWHRAPDGPAVYIESEEDLVTMFPGKFKAVPQFAQAPKPPKATPPMRGDGLDDRVNAGGVGSNPAETPAEAGREGPTDPEHLSDTPDAKPGDDDKSSPPKVTGEDVTDQFPKAGENDLKVLHTPDRFHAVLDGDKVLAENLRTKPDVRRWLSNHLSEKESGGPSGTHD